MTLGIFEALRYVAKDNNNVAITVIDGIKWHLKISKDGIPYLKDPVGLIKDFAITETTKEYDFFDKEPQLHLVLVIHELSGGTDMVVSNRTVLMDDEDFDETDYLRDYLKSHGLEDDEEEFSVQYYLIGYREGEDNEKH